MRNFYYIDASALFEEGFLPLLEGLLGKKDTAFLLDSDIYSDIEGSLALGEEERALTLEAYVNLLATLPGSMQVDTAGGTDPTPLFSLPDGGKLTVLTARESLVESFSTLGSKVRFCRVSGGELLPFSRAPHENGEAFYLAEDHYVNRFDIKDIDSVFSPRYGYLRLDKSRELAGGEGVCYRTYGGLLCKLYFESHISYVNFKRLQQMVEMGCTDPHIAWPLDILYHRGRFVGYLMRELSGVRSVDELRDDGFSGFRVLDRFIIARNFLAVVAYLHRQNILVGDMKPDNIMVGKDAQVYLIDAGSFQVADYPCDVCHKEYTERIYMEDQLKRILRSVREEYYPINKILFEILMLKGPYYSRDNTEIDGDGARIFAYPDLPPEGEQPLSYHLRVWFALSPRMRQFFAGYFREGRITYLDDWVRELDVYIRSKQKTIKKGE